jgi:LCP family protein required for cell wall assembly
VSQLDNSSPDNQHGMSPNSNEIPLRAVPIKPKPPKRLRRIGFGVIGIFLVILFLLLSSTVGGLAGYMTGQAELQLGGAIQASLDIHEQYQLARNDFQSGNLDVARQRYEWIINQDPSYPGAADGLSQVLAILYATATPTPIPPTITPTPTRDLRPVQDLFSNAQSLFTGESWQETIDTIVNLRQTDPDYEVVEVDRMLFISLRNLGVDKIYQIGDLEGGLYDLSLAEKFSPLDVKAKAAREWARLYVIGLGFWEAYPEQAVFYFSQVASALPSLRDASGWSAIERLRSSWIQWGDQLFTQESWCDSQNKYEQAALIRMDNQLQVKLDLAILKCTPPTQTITQTTTLTATLTETPTLTLQPTFVVTSSPSATVTVTSTPSPTMGLPTPPSPTASPTTIAPTPTNTPLPPATAEPSPTSEPSPTPGTGSLFTPASLVLRYIVPLAVLLFAGVISPKKGLSTSKTKNTKKLVLLWVRRLVVPLFIISLVGVLGLLLAGGSFMVGRELARFGTGLSGVGEPSISENTQGTVVDTSGTGLGDDGNSADSVSDLQLTELTPWDGAGRVTVLLLGLDYRDWESGEKYSRSDTMILLTLDPLTRTAGILSIPRDMWVAIPGFKHGKINTAYYLGEAYKLPGGGPQLAVKTVESFLGVPINYYAQVDFETFVRFIDEIGGVKITIPEKITVDLLGAGAKTKKNLKPGEQVLPGQWALAYARARYTSGGDFDRAGRQQQVIMGVRDRILDFNMLPDLISKAPTLYRELSSGIRTNLSLDQVIQLALLSQSVSDENIQKGVLGSEYVIFGRSPDNLSILIPLSDKIHQMRDQIFASSGSLGPRTPGNSAQQMAAESPRISILNGTADSSLVDRTGEWLSQNGTSIVDTGNADQAYTYSVVIDYTGNPFTVKYLVESMGISANRIYSEYDPSSPVDVQLILGRDWENSIP